MAPPGHPRAWTSERCSHPQSVIKTFVQRILSSVCPNNDRLVRVRTYLTSGKANGQRCQNTRSETGLTGTVFNLLQRLFQIAIAPRVQGCGSSSRHLVAARESMWPTPRDTNRTTPPCKGSFACAEAAVLERKRALKDSIWKRSLYFFVSCHSMQTLRRRYLREAALG